MPVNLNLLPPELSVSKKLDSFLKTTRALGVIGVIVFLIFGVGIGVFFIISKLTFDNVNAKVSILKKQVSAQEQTEQQTVLLKDRLDKIALVQNSPSLLSNLGTIEPILTNFSDNVAINQIKVDPVNTTLSINIKTNSDLDSFLTSIQNPDAFSSVILTSFGLNTTTGYLTDVQLIKK